MIKELLRTGLSWTEGMIPRAVIGEAPLRDLKKPVRASDR